MADAKVFQLKSGMSAETVGRALERYLRERKHMEAEGTGSPEGGYFLQARQLEEWKKFVGMDRAVQVNITPYGNSITVDVGAGRWVDKLGAATVGYLLFAPLMLTAAIGAVGQGKLCDDIFDFVARYVQLHGKTAETETAQGECAPRTCRGCQANVPEGARFCPQCGRPVSEPPTCPNCHTTVPEGAKFCVSCGTPLE